MTTTEIKVEIHKVVDKLPDEVANQALDYLKSLLNEKPDSSITKNFDKILKEDSGLLNRLAQ